MKLIHYARIKNGKLELKQRSVFYSDIEKLKDGEYILTLEKKTKKRSLSQNAYYHTVVVPIVCDGLNDVGYRVTRTETHEFLKGRFAREEKVNEKTGEVMEIKGRTSNMTTSKMMDYFSEITQWAAEYLKVQIPQPNEQLTLIP